MSNINSITVQWTVDAVDGDVIHLQTANGESQAVEHNALATTGWVNGGRQ